MVADSDTLERPKVEAVDASVGAYLELLNKDIGRGVLGRFQKAAIERWQSLVAHVKIDRENDRIEGDVTVTNGEESRTLPWIATRTP